MPSRNAGASRSSGRPGPEVQIAFDELLATGDADDGQDAEVAQNRPSVLDDLNADAAAMGLDSVVNELAKLERSGSPGLPADLFGEVSPKVVVRFCQRAPVEAPSELPAHAPAPRAALVAIRNPPRQTIGECCSRNAGSSKSSRSGLECSTDHQPGECGTLRRQLTSSSTPPADDTRKRVRSIIEEELARVKTIEDAEAVIRRAERLAESKTEDQAGKRAADAPTSAPTEVERAEAAAPTQPAGVADVLVETAAQAVAPTPEAPAVVQGAQEAIGADHAAPGVPPPARHGRSLLRQAVLRRMGPFQALDARIYLEVNGQTRPRWLDDACKVVTVATTGGWIWVLGTILANRLGVPGSGPAARAVIPSVILSTWIAEYPVKAYFRRRRPFIDVVRALVVGKEPGSWSFPSRHACAAFAAAWILSRYWPRTRLLFFGVASTLGYSRVYVGAHYPGDVVTGAALGMTCSELIRRATERLLA
jgi:undecaprenyl-diphosphatase